MAALDSPRAETGGWSSVRLLGRGIARRWWLLVVGVALGSLDVAERLTGEPVDFPAAVSYGVLAVGLIVAVVGTFHDERVRALALAPSGGGLSDPRVDHLSAELRRAEAWERDLRHLARLQRDLPVAHDIVKWARDLEAWLMEERPERGTEFRRTPHLTFPRPEDEPDLMSVHDLRRLLEGRIPTLARIIQDWREELRS